VEVPWTGRTYAGCELKVVELPTFDHPVHGPETLEAVAYCAWFGLHPVAAEVSMKYVLPRLNRAGASRCASFQKLPTTLAMPR